MFFCSHPLAVFDHLRVPYEIKPYATTADARPATDAPPAECAALAPLARPDRSLWWPVFADDSPSAWQATGPRRFRLGSLLLHARIVADPRLDQWLTSTGQGWHPVVSLANGEEHLGSVWRNENGDMFLPFDPNEVVSTFWSERYAVGAEVSRASRLRSMAVAAYYRIRPFTPRRLQIAARRLYSHVQARTTFPRWPVEPSLHQFFHLMLGWAANLAGEAVPHIASWPAGRSWALVLTHDVETAEGLRNMPLLRDLESATGHRSSWNLVPGRYDVPDAIVDALHDDGFEVGLHGLYHDGRDLAAGVFEVRLPEMQWWAERWRASGFRSPATHRAWQTMACLPFEYDSSYPDTDPFEPQPGGCCSWLPYFIGSIVELPITLPQDHTVFVILRHRDGAIWVEKTEQIRAAGGMALLITHPDYLDQAPIASAYEEMLNHFADDQSVWRALPVEVNRWWRRRAESRLERAEGGWQVAGPASAEARIMFASPTDRASP
jgi:hypothetical protein